MTGSQNKLAKKFFYCWKELRMSEPRLASKFNLTIDEVKEVKSKLMSVAELSDWLALRLHKTKLSLTTDAPSVKKEDASDLDKYSINLEEEILKLEKDIEEIL
jgi:hypothetical protein